MMTTTVYMRKNKKKEMRTGAKNKYNLTSEPDHSTVLTLPAVRDYSTGGGHTQTNTLMEGKVPTQKWQGYPPKNLHIVGKPVPPLPEVSMPRFLGRAQYATRISFPNTLYVKILRSPYARANITSIDTSKAVGIAGVHAIVTHENTPKTIGLQSELKYVGDIVAAVAADTEDIAEDALDQILISYERLEAIATLDEAIDRSEPLRVDVSDPAFDPTSSASWKHGNFEEAISHAEVVRHYEYNYPNQRILPLQPASCVAIWKDDDNLTFWGLDQKIHVARTQLANMLGMDENKIRFVDKWNGGTFGGSLKFTGREQAIVAFIAKLTKRPTKWIGSQKDSLSQFTVKPNIRMKIELGASRAGEIVALKAEAFVNAGCFNSIYDENRIMVSGNSRNNLFLYGPNISNWKYIANVYRSNSPETGCTRSCPNQEFSWAIECAMDEIATELGLDPLEFKFKHAAKPGQKLDPATDWDHAYATSPALKEDLSLTFDSYASEQVIKVAAEKFGWPKRTRLKRKIRNGRFRRGVGVSLGHVHGGFVPYAEYEPFFSMVKGTSFRAEVELNGEGIITVRNGMSDSGTDHDTPVAQQVAEVLGYSNLEKIRVIWGDTELTPPTGSWFAARTSTCQGGASIIAAAKLKAQLFELASKSLAVQQSKLTTKDGNIWDMENPKRRTSFAELVEHSGGTITTEGEVKTPDATRGRPSVMDVGAVFVEVEVDTWTGQWKVLRVLQSVDTGNQINPLLSESDMDGAYLQGLNSFTDAIPYQRDFAGFHTIMDMGYLDYRITNINEMPDEMTHLFVNSLEPRWFFGIKGYSETTIGVIPSAISNAIYDAVGVRIRNIPISQEELIRGLQMNIHTN
jgi:CO/xanthine dehydrogenase Mo-binding subunit